MSDNTQTDDSKDETNKLNEANTNDEAVSTVDSELSENVTTVDGLLSGEAKDKDDDQEKMDVDENTESTEPEESHTKALTDRVLPEEKVDQIPDDQSNTMEDGNINDDEKGDNQRETEIKENEGNNKKAQCNTVEDVEMDKTGGEEQTPSDLVEDTSITEGINISEDNIEDVNMTEDNNEDVNMTEEKDINEKEHAESSNEQAANSSTNDESKIKSTEDNNDSNAGKEDVSKDIENSEMDCAENNDTQIASSTAPEIVGVDEVDDITNGNDKVDKEIEESEAKSDEISDKGDSVDENNTDKGESQNNNQSEDNVDKNVEDTIEKHSESKGNNIEAQSSSMRDGQMVSTEDKDKDNSILETSNLNDEHSVFVQINSEKDDVEKSSNSIDQATNEVDPIGSSEWSQNTEPTDSSFVSDLDDADECIIPDASKDDSSIIPSSQESNESTLASTPTSSGTTESDSMRLSEKYLVSVANTQEESPCMICDKKKVSKYNCVKHNDKTTLCSEECLTKLKEKYAENVIVRKLRVKNFSTDLQGSNEADTRPVVPSLVVTGNIHCKNCKLLIANINNSLSWEAFDFCDEMCLTKHQKMIGSHCANCRIEVKENFLGKYCVRFGYNVRQFCSSVCLEQYKKNSKVCSFCQDDISNNTGGFVTSIADKGMAKDFCSAHCMHKYSDISKHLKGPISTAECCVCHKNNIVEIEFEYKNKKTIFCSQPCFVAFKYVNEVSPTKCDMCCKYFVTRPLGDTFLIRYDGVLRKFCEKTCQNIYITTNRKIVYCCWCKVRKYNFDMIQKYTPDNNTVIIICSLTCLNFFNASANATKLKKKRCDYCHKICKGQYHITLADNSMKNFCSYPCVQEYQNKYITAPARFAEQPVAVPSTTTTTARITRKAAGVGQRKQIIPDVPGPLPIITSVRSLAPIAGQSMTTRSLRSKSSGPTIATITTLQETTAPSVRRIVLVRPPELPQQRNVSTLVKPMTADAEAEIKPIMVDKAVQTEDIKDSLVLLPVPVPIYLPAPMQSFNLIHPLPLPFPLPVPIPMFMPVTKQTASIVLKDMKETEIRTDPYEADLLMMAELVAGENEKKEQPESEGEGESDVVDTAAEPAFSPEQQDPNNSFADDMLQMALKMASDFEEPAVDLEGALTASTITATPGSASNEQVDDVPNIQPPVERPTFRGKRRGRPPRHGGRGRGRGRPPIQPEVVMPVQEQQPPPEPVEKPDANMCLKYTFGVNAWKQWVTTKNAELEKTSRRPKLFKSDLLQLTSDELNYSLCLFVKEVRKPNGAEYAPDTIYYLCLGVQQYLFENGRIDNIFCDTYYESFTDCLDEVCKKFSTLYNDSQYIVTRVEEEHLWESKQLGAHSPHVLLSTLMFFNTKHFNLTNVEEHMQLSFSHIMKHWKRVAIQPGQPKNATSRNILLRFYPPQSSVEGNNRKKKVYEQQENEENPLRCPVKLYEFYLSKCPESVKTRNDVFYLLPERSCVPDSPVWYSTMALGKEALEKMLHRVKMVKEINVALLAS